MRGLVSFILYSIFVVPFVNSSQEHVKPSNKNSIDQLSSKLQFEMRVHGFLLWASMGFLLPVGILIIRMSHRQECGRRLKIIFYLHSALQICSLLLITAGAVLSIKNFNNSFNNHHQRIGLALYGMVWLQSLIGFTRPQRGCRKRNVWFCLHWILGTTVSILGILNIYTGLQAYQHKTSRSIGLWVIIFTTQLSVIVFLYLLQDKWLYIQKQGLILGDEPVSSTDIQPISSHEKKMESNP